jgi:hypothetical protein
VVINTQYNCTLVAMVVVSLTAVGVHETVHCRCAEAMVRRCLVVFGRLSSFLNDLEDRTKQ